MTNWLVVEPPRCKTLVTWDDDIPNIWKIQNVSKCPKPPSSPKKGRFQHLEILLCTITTCWGPWLVRLNVPCPLAQSLGCTCSRLLSMWQLWRQEVDEEMTCLVTSDLVSNNAIYHDDLLHNLDGNPSPSLFINQPMGIWDIYAGHSGAKTWHLMVWNTIHCHKRTICQKPCGTTWNNFKLQSENYLLTPSNSSNGHPVAVLKVTTLASNSERCMLRSTSGCQVWVQGIRLAGLYTGLVQGKQKVLPSGFIKHGVLENGPCISDFH